MKEKIKNLWTYWRSCDEQGNWVALLTWTIVFSVWVSVFVLPVFMWQINIAYVWCLLPTFITLVASPQARTQWGRWLVLTLIVATSNSGFFPFMYAIGYTWLVWSRHRYARVKDDEQ